MKSRPIEYRKFESLSMMFWLLKKNLSGLSNYCYLTINWLVSLSNFMIWLYFMLLSEMAWPPNIIRVSSSTMCSPTSQMRRSIIVCRTTQELRSMSSCWMDVRSPRVS